MFKSSDHIISIPMNLNALSRRWWSEFCRTGSLIEKGAPLEACLTNPSACRPSWTPGFRGTISSKAATYSPTMRLHSGDNPPRRALIFQPAYRVPPRPGAIPRLDAATKLETRLRCCRPSHGCTSSHGSHNNRVLRCPKARKIVSHIGIGNEFGGNSGLA